MNPEAVMFDLDGTLIDSVPAYYQILDIILTRLHLPPASKEALSDLVKGGKEAVDKLIPQEMKHRKEELRQEIHKIASEVSPEIFRKEVRLIPGVPELMARLSALRIPIGLVTSSHTRTLETKLLPLKNAGIDGLIDVTITNDDTEERKPAPGPLIECARRLGVSREMSVYVGDSYVDLRAGRAAGMMTIGVLTGMDDFDTLKSEDPDLIVNSVSDLREIFWQGVL